MIYMEFNTWWDGIKYRSKMVFIGSLGFVYFGLICGIVSLFYYVIRQINAFFRRETIAGCIVAFMMLLMTIGWITTFVRERSLRVEAQHNADSLAYDLSKFTQMYDTTKSIVVNGDTVRYHYQ